MTTITFDTLNFVRKLEDAGFEEKQAEAVCAVFRDAQNESELVTKSDITTVRQDMKEMELRLEAKISDIKFDLIKWMAAMLIAQAGLVAALVKLL